MALSMKRSLAALLKTFRKNICLRRRELSGLAASTQNSVYISTSQCIYHNLALEDWIYNNVDFSNHQFLVLLWRNKPCIVIGRHQNIWAECNVSKCITSGVDIARRRSGGGAVYHDLGNLNCTVFTHKKDYNRERNLKLVASALQERWKLNATVSERDDLLLDSKYKISGTGAKIGGKVAYHHFTLLIDVQTDKLHELLTTGLYGLTCKATMSVPSKVCNLKSVIPSLTYDKIITELSKTFKKEWNCQQRAEFIDPSKESHFPGISSMRNELKQWEWMYAKTPPFTIQQSLFINQMDYEIEAKVVINIDKGIIQSFDVECPDNDLMIIGKECSQLLQGERLTLLDINEKLNSSIKWNHLNSNATEFVQKVKDIMK